MTSTVLIAVPSLASATTTATWLSPTFGTWSVPANWSTNPAYPDSPAYDVLFPATGPAYNAVLSSAVSVNSVHLTSPNTNLILNAQLATATGVTLDAGSLTINNAGSLTGPLTANPSSTVNLAQPLSALPAATTFSDANLVVSGYYVHYSPASFRTLSATNTSFRIGNTAVLDLASDNFLLPNNNSFALAGGGTLYGGTVSSNITAYPGTNASTLYNTVLAAELTLVPGANADGYGTFSLNNGTIRFLGPGDFNPGSPTLAGTGQVIFDNTSPTRPLLHASSSDLTIAPGITVRTGDTPNSTGAIGTIYDALVNQGTISAQTPGSVLTLAYNSLSNTGTIEARNNATIRLSTSPGTIYSTSLPNVATSNGGAYYLLGGTLDTSFGLTISASRNFGVSTGTTVKNGYVASPDNTPFSIYLRSPGTTSVATLNGVNMLAPISVPAGARLTVTGTSVLERPVTVTSATLDLNGWSLPATGTSAGSISLTAGSTLNINTAPAGSSTGPLSLTDSAAYVRAPLSAPVFASLVSHLTRSSLTLYATATNTGNTLSIPADSSLVISATGTNFGSVTGGTLAATAPGSSISFDAPGYGISLNSVALAGAVTVTGGTQVNLGATTLNDAAISVAAAGSSTLLATNALAGTATISFDGTSSDNHFSGDISSGITLHTGTQGGTVNTGTLAGTISAQTPGKSLSLYASAFTGTIQALSGSSISLENLPAVYGKPNGYLAGGTWSVQDNAAITFPAPLYYLDANVTLAGPNSTFADMSYLTQNLGSLTLTNRRSLTISAASHAFTNIGIITLGPSSVLRVNGDMTNPGTLSLSAPTSLFLHDYPSYLFPNATPPADSLRQQLLTRHITTPLPNTALAYAEASLLLHITGTQTATFAGQTVDATTLLLLPTLPGDANLNGKIDLDDYALLDRAYARSLTNAHWTDGDFNYDGIIDSNDYLLIDTTYGQAQGFTPGFLAMRESQFGPAYISQLLAAVPEPSSLAGLLVASLLTRRLRRPVNPRRP